MTLRQILIEAVKIEETDINDKTKYPSRVSAETIQSVRDFEEARKDMFAFIEDNDEVFNTFMELVLRYNTAHTTAKAGIKTIRTDKRMKVGPFVRSAKPEKVVWDSATIPDWILKDRNVIKDLDSKYLDGLMEAGMVSEDVVKHCRKIIHTTPRVTGPKPVVIDP